VERGGTDLVSWISLHQREQPPLMSGADSGVASNPAGELRATTGHLKYHLLHQPRQRSYGR
jgi:hypothetical protein